MGHTGVLAESTALDHQSAQNMTVTDQDIAQARFFEGLGTPFTGEELFDLVSDTVYFLKDAEGNRNDAVLFDPQTDSVDVQWVVDGVPQTRTFPNEAPAGYAELPEADFAESSPELLRC